MPVLRLLRIDAGCWMLDARFWILKFRFKSDKNETTTITAVNDCFDRSGTGY